MPMWASTFRWLQRKRYQYEVTFSLYMLTPTEKFIFNSFLFLFVSMMLIAAALYLPQHMAFLTRRAFFYYHGDDAAAKSVLPDMATQTGMHMRDAVESLRSRTAVEKVVSATINVVSEAREL
ncbi:MAG: hypothetical protein M1818_008481 [Claussenomyces sp. TS43310]|nr:MAG: hypothetical protein M1818_008481 [Claussenomyces sp. TS43310]